MSEPVSKAILAQKYRYSASTLQRWMNVHYYDELVAVGYRKSMKLLPPIIVQKFIELHGSSKEYEV